MAPLKRRRKAKPAVTEISTVRNITLCASGSERLKAPTTSPVRRRVEQLVEPTSATDRAAGRRASADGPWKDRISTAIIGP